MPNVDPVLGTRMEEVLFLLFRFLSAQTLFERVKIGREEVVGKSWGRFHKIWALFYIFLRVPLDTRRLVGGSRVQY